MRVGSGWDLHRLVPGRPLILGGLTIAPTGGCEAHSDGDILCHALIDALLGAAALGDIGERFPPEDPRYKDASSLELLRDTAALLRRRGWDLVNGDCTVVLEAPRLGPRKEEIARHLETVLALPAGRISVKAKTAEGLGPLGESRAAEAFATVLIEERRGDDPPRSGPSGLRCPPCGGSPPATPPAPASVAEVSPAAPD